MSNINQRIMDAPPVNRKIYEFIINNEYTVRQFAIKIGVAQQSIQRLFSIDKQSGKYPLPSTYIKKAMMTNFGMDYDWFIVDDVIANNSKSPIGTDNASRLERLIIAKDYLKQTGRARSVHSIAECMNKAKSNITNIFGGKSQISERFLYMFNEAFDNIFNITWLIKGEGTLLAEKHDIDEDQTISLLQEIERLKELLNDASAEIVKLSTENRTLKQQLYGK